MVGPKNRFLLSLTRNFSANLLPTATASYHLRKKCPSGECSLTYKLFSEIDEDSLFLLTVRFLNAVLEIQNCDLATVCVRKRAAKLLYALSVRMTLDIFSCDLSYSQGKESFGIKLLKESLGTRVSSQSL